MMDSDELDKLVGQIRKDYVLIQKGKLWMIFGGFIGVLTAAGLISYGSAKAVLASATAKQVEQEITELKATAEKQVEEITDMHQTYKKQLDNLSSYEQRIETVEAAFENKTVKAGTPYYILGQGKKGYLVVRGKDYSNATPIVFATGRAEGWQFVPAQ
ncbi:hypothetical protein DESC_460145 [Desulfosarcina cetonica]|nr:hypothetical protein DESC_460145 [Desulfosarcina cetonica]